MNSPILLLDVNVWLALSITRHEHCLAAQTWFSSLGAGDRLGFCRLTQLSFLRLLSQEAVMGRESALGQSEAWQVYDRWLGVPAVKFMPEPNEIELHFRKFANAAMPMPRRWADDYLIAFTVAAELRLVTLDRGLSRRVPGAILLGG